MTDAAAVVAALGRIGADARDDEELRQKKALLVLVAIAARVGQTRLIDNTVIHVNGRR